MIKYEKSFKVGPQWLLLMEEFCITDKALRKERFKKLLTSSLP